MKLMYHDDDCGELLNQSGECPKCRYHPDMQSTAFREVPDDVVADLTRKGWTFLGLRRVPVGPATAQSV